MATQPIPDQLTLETQLGGPMQFHGLIAPSLPPDPIRSHLGYVRHWQGEEQLVNIYNAPFVVPSGVDAVVLAALLRAPPLQNKLRDWKVVVTGEQLDALIREVDPLVNLTATEVMDALQRLRMAGVSIDAPHARRRFSGFQFLSELRVSSRERVTDGFVVFNEASVQLSETVLSLHLFGMLNPPEAEGA
ncbi:hypothetical protein [Deinococcus sp. QL22]|uniref:hypothetical protein n=1 Tax=Deinococcus sp. QL22 TaxID=2939437 RepID=UPI002018098B|nr:hypothetical protein [Deinococcus sp. QL22]UQN10646.1 hypothetical protein M1R55_30185 [Deinococcus sp. QL22]